jgi:hypothetical protein
VEIRKNLETRKNEKIVRGNREKGELVKIG